MIHFRHYSQLPVRGRSFLILLCSTIFLLVSGSFFVLYIWKKYSLILPPPQVERGIVLGASVTHDGQLSPLLQQRVDYSKWMLKDQNIRRLLVSGYDAGPEYQEATSIANYLLAQWVTDTSLMVDGLGLDTYDSLWRAKNVYHIDRLIIFTQSFHLPRSLYIARKLWIEAWWIAVDPEGVSSYWQELPREFFARIKAFFEVEIGNRCSL